MYIKLSPLVSLPLKESLSSCPSFQLKRKSIWLTVWQGATFTQNHGNFIYQLPKLSIFFYSFWFSEKFYGSYLCRTLISFLSALFCLVFSCGSALGSWVEFFGFSSNRSLKRPIFKNLLCFIYIRDRIEGEPPRVVSPKDWSFRKMCHFRNFEKQPI